MNATATKTSRISEGTAVYAGLWHTSYAPGDAVAYQPKRILWENNRPQQEIERSTETFASLEDCRREVDRLNAERQKARGEAAVTIDWTL